MTANPYRDHLAERVLGADPLDLIVLLYEELLQEITAARRCLAAGDAFGRARAVSRATEIVTELVQAVDSRADAALSDNLLRLYAFLIENLQSGHATQTDAPLAHCERVAQTLLEAWQGIQTSSRASSEEPMPAATSHAQPRPALSITG